MKGKPPALTDKTKDRIMEHAVRPAWFVPETLKADILFRNMKKEHEALAVVLDEYGGMEGIITMNDLIEELVGDLGEDTPEAEAAEPHLEQIGDNTWQVFGNVELSDMEETLGIVIELEDAETFTGLVYHVLGRVPPDGDQNLQLEFQNLSNHVSRIENHQVELAEIVLLPNQSANDA